MCGKRCSLGEEMFRVEFHDISLLSVKSSLQDEIRGFTENVTYFHRGVRLF